MFKDLKKNFYELLDNNNITNCETKSDENIIIHKKRQILRKKKVIILNKII
jgi:hypothetical protein